MLAGTQLSWACSCDDNSFEIHRALMSARADVPGSIRPCWPSQRPSIRGVTEQGDCFDNCAHGACTFILQGVLSQALQLVLLSRRAIRLASPLGAATSTRPPYGGCSGGLRRSRCRRTLDRCFADDPVSVAVLRRDHAMKHDKGLQVNWSQVVADLERAGLSRAAIAQASA